MIELRDYQVQLVDGIKAAIGAGKRDIIGVAPTGAGKCFAPGTPIMLLDGTAKPVEQVQAGDILMGPDGGGRLVTSTTSGREMMYRVTPKKGEPYTVNESHILSLRHGPAGAIVNIEVREYLQRSERWRLQHFGWRKPGIMRGSHSCILTGISVEPVGSGDYYGFTLDGPDRLFLLGDFTVAHNTTIFSHITTGASSKGRKVLILAHRQELVAQGADTMARFGLRHEIIASAPVRAAVAVSHLKNYGKPLVDPLSNVRVASVQTLVGRMAKMRWVPDIIIIDEAHHCTEGSTWGKVLDFYREKNPDLLVLHFTATPCRLDGKGLGRGAGGYADHMVIGPSIGELIRRGFLTRPVVYAPPNALDLTGIRSRYGDYAKGELEAALDKPAITGDAVAHYKKICPGEPAVAFCAGVAHAKHVAEEFQRAGFKAVALDGTTEDTKRRAALAGLGNGSVQIVTSADLIGEGVDIPAVRAAILLRPTQSLSLYIQQTGRALRTVYAKGMPLDTDQQRLAAIAAGPKPNAIILDHVGNTITHGLIDEDRSELWTLDGMAKRKGKAANDNVPLPSTCPACFAVHMPAPNCPVCGHEYKVKPRQLDQVDGELVELTDEMAERMRRQKRKEVGGAQTIEQLREIEKQRGYRPGWADHVFAARQKRRA